MILKFIESAALLIALCWLHALNMRHVQRQLLRQLLAGGLFGAICVVGMLAPLQLHEGLIFDARTVVLSMAGLFGGPLVATIAGLMAGAYRLWLGGVGVIPGLFNILMPVLLGLAYRAACRRNWLRIGVWQLLVFGALVHLLLVLSLSLLPAKDFSQALRQVAVPIFLVLTPATLLLGLLLQDIYRQARDRQALRESEARLRAINEASPDLTLLLDEEGRYLEVMAPEPWLDYGGGAGLLEKRLTDVLAVGQAEKFMAFIARTLASDSPQTLEYGMQTPAGHRVFEGRARRLDTPLQGKRAVVVIARDITDRINFELDRRIAAIAFESQQGMLITDASTRILKVNQAFCQISGYSAADVIGRTTQMLSSGRQGPEFYQAMWQALAETGVWAGEIWNRRKNGEVFPEWLVISAVRDERGRVSNYVASLADISERKCAEEKIKHLAFYDALTGLPNRRLLRDRLQQARALSRRSGQYAALVFLDLDNFKNVNDLYGHQVGDELLCQVAERLRHSLRERDTVARLGGDEFVVMLEGLKSCAEEAASQVEHLGAKVLETLRRPYLAGGHSLFSSASLGVVLFCDEQHSVDELMQQADLSMYTAKAAGKNALSFYDPQMQEAVSARLQLEEDLRRGLQDGEFPLFLQPQVDQLGHLTGAEVLVRWQHPQRGLLGPDAFIGIAERSGLIEALDMQVLGAACALLAHWAQQPHSAGLSLSVNLSARLLYQAGFIEALQQLLQVTGANPQRLKLELTESLLLADMQEASTRMQTLRNMGIRFAIDDFGTGYSSMAYLQQLPLDQLKIDQSFIGELPSNSSSLAIVRAIVALAESLELEVIAEGVETQAQRDGLRAHGCVHYQGYLFGRPMAVADFTASELFQLRLAAAVREA
ncbi:EAL domain-containing protein [Pseudomonas sp. sp1636]|uniref:EAL domain-containing protein n=1 Tax=Pseudomonas sp. sp1636 TaxID=3036707 RepID=UPI0025A5D1AD|nr:EAL domain-containing protein [Pseudomonas sp. sp1636]MDM8348043.1 EAL domain-containing protein [Pseudomonas sp. sp1636]